jgi:hypothetical protein
VNLPGNNSDLAEKCELLHRGREGLEQLMLERLSSNLDVLTRRVDGLVGGRDSEGLLLALTGLGVRDNVDGLLFTSTANRGESAAKNWRHDGLNRGAACGAHHRSAHDGHTSHSTECVGL